MANLNGVTINKGSMGTNTVAVGDEISGMVLQGPATTNFEHEAVHVVYNLNDVKALGMDEGYDTSNNVNAYRHISEFYRMAGEGTKLYLILTDQSKNMENMFTDSSEGADDSSVKRLIITAGGEIRQIAISTNPEVEPASSKGINDDCYNSIPLAQGVALWAYDNHMPLQFLLEARNFDDSSTDIADLRKITDVSATKVSVVIGQDYGYASEFTVGTAKKYADVGTALGTLSSAFINQNIGENQVFNLTDSTKKSWLTAGLSNNKKISDLFSSLQILENKGYIFGVTYTGLAGVRWNNDHTCVEIIKDAEGNLNEHTISYGRTLDKAIRLLRSVYLPKVKTVQPVDSSTGKLSAGVIKNFDAMGESVLGDMVTRREISDFEVKTDSNSDLLLEKVLKVSFKIIPYGTIGEIRGTINLKTNL